MKRYVSLIAVATVAIGAYAVRNIDVNVLMSRLAEAQEFSAKVEYKVLLPSADDPICYSIKMASSVNDDDSLAAADYLLEWSLAKESGVQDGFTAYFAGNYYRYRDKLLREYHYDNEPEVFAPCGDASSGMQNQAQFCNLLPQYIALTLKSMAIDSTYRCAIHTDTLIAQHRVIAVDGVRSYRGEEAQRFVYVFDRDLMPVSIELINNPGQTSEQLITAIYDYGDESLPVITSEEMLAERYPEAFAKFRESAFTFENLPGRRLPAFSSPTPTGERYTFSKNSRLARPTVIVILDSDDDGASQLIAELRKKIDTMDEKSDLILAFINNNADAIENTAGRLRPGEHILMSARGLARDCGVKTTPVIIECDMDGTVVSAVSQQ